MIHFVRFAKKNIFLSELLTLGKLCKLMSIYSTLSLPPFHTRVSTHTHMHTHAHTHAHTHTHTHTRTRAHTHIHAHAQTCTLSPETGLICHSLGCNSSECNTVPRNQYCDDSSTSTKQHCQVRTCVYVCACMYTYVHTQHMLGMHSVLFQRIGVRSKFTIKGKQSLMVFDLTASPSLIPALVPGPWR